MVISKVDAQSRKPDGGANYFANVLLKVNLKLGGINHCFGEDIEALDTLSNVPTMFVGIDVSHPAPNSMLNAPSVASVVASQDRYYCQYPGYVRIQEGKVEMVKNIGAMFRDRLRVFGQRNRIYPSQIIIYRDGRLSSSVFTASLILEFQVFPKVNSKRSWRRK